MWICLTDAFFSIVEHWDDENTLVVRARFKGDIEKVFGQDKGEVHFTPQNDYPYRAHLERDEVAEVIKGEVNNIAYGNFKNEAHRQAATDQDHRRVAAYHDVWRALNNAGDDGIYKTKPHPGQASLALVGDDDDDLLYDSMGFGSLDADKI